MPLQEIMLFALMWQSKKVENLKKGIIPIYEPGLEQMVKSAQQRGNLKFTTDIKEALKESDICLSQWEHLWAKMAVLIYNM